MASGFGRVSLASRTVGRGYVRTPRVAARAVPPREVGKKNVQSDKNEKRVAGAPALSTASPSVKATRVDVGEIFPPSGAKSSPPDRRDPGANSQGQFLNLEEAIQAAGSVARDFSDSHKAAAKEMHIYVHSLEAAVHFYTNVLGWEIDRARTHSGGLYNRAWVKVGENERLHLIEINLCDETDDDAVCEADFAITIPYGSMGALMGRLTSLGLSYKTSHVKARTITFIDLHGYIVEAEEIWHPLA